MNPADLAAWSDANRRAATTYAAEATCQCGALLAPNWHRHRPVCDPCRSVQLLANRAAQARVRRAKSKKDD